MVGPMEAPRMAAIGCLLRIVSRNHATQSNLKFFYLQYIGVTLSFHCHLESRIVSECTHERVIQIVIVGVRKAPGGLDSINIEVNFKRSVGLNIDLFPSSLT